MRIGRLITPILLLVAYMAAGCSHDDLPPRNEEASIPIVYNARIHTQGTEDSRAVGATDLTEFYDNFYVRSFKTMPPDDSRHEVMPNYTVKFDNGKSEWQYDGLTSVSGAEQYLKYWDLSAKSYMFAAVAPVPDNSATADYSYETTHVTIENDGEIKITGVKGNMSSIGDKTENSVQAPDWMVARTVRRGIKDASKLLDYDDIAEDVNDIDKDGKSTFFQKPNAPFADVPMMFHHICARVDFLAYATKTLPVSKFKVYISDDSPYDDKIINQGNYSTTDGWTDREAVLNDQQDPKRFADYPYLTARTIGTDAENPILLASNVQIPQEWLSPGRELKITIETTEKDADDNFITYNGTIILTPTNNGSNSWLQNKHYTYILKIVADGADSEIILFEVDMDKWKWKPGSEIEDPESDW